MNNSPFEWTNPIFLHAYNTNRKQNKEEQYQDTWNQCLDFSFLFTCTILTRSDSEHNIFLFIFYIHRFTTHFSFNLSPLTSKNLSFIAISYRYNGGLFFLIAQC